MVGMNLCVFLLTFQTGFPDQCSDPVEIPLSEVGRRPQRCITIAIPSKQRASKTTLTVKKCPWFSIRSLKRVSLLERSEMTLSAFLVWARAGSLDPPLTFRQALWLQDAVCSFTKPSLVSTLRRAGCSMALCNVWPQPPSCDLSKSPLNSPTWSRLHALKAYLAYTKLYQQCAQLVSLCVWDVWDL